MSERPERGPIVVGLSSNVIDPALRQEGFDGIGVYTAALERALRDAGAIIRRIGAPQLVGPRLRFPSSADIRSRVPFAAAIAWSALSGAPAPIAGALDGIVDVYHCTDYRTPRLPRTPVVTTLYDAIPFARPAWGNPRLRRLKNWLLRSAAANADRIIAISAAAVDDLVEHYRIDPARVRVVHLGVADDWFEIPATDVRDEARERALVPGYFLFVGTLQPRKNVMALIDAYERLPSDVRASRQLVIVGRYGWAAQDVREVLTQRRAAGRVVWLEYVERERLRALYRDAGLFVFPSLAEGFGLPVLEALASGLPVIASDLPVVREVAGDHAVLVDVGDVDSLSHAMERVSGVARTPDADRARRSWARGFDWRICAARTMDVYRELVVR